MSDTKKIPQILCLPASLPPLLGQIDPFAHSVRQGLLVESEAETSAMMVLFQWEYYRILDLKGL